MKPYYKFEDTIIYCGDVLKTISAFDSNSINCCVTSPPYWGLRDYGHEDQFGAETFPEEYIENMVKVFREVYRVLRKDGTLWLNLGDSYWNNYGGGSNTMTTGNSKAVKQKGRHNKPKHSLFKIKDLVGIPWRVAFALQSDGWYLRQDIIWHKPNAMPESVTDRCTKSHEYIFLLTKSQRYFYDSVAVKEPLSESSIQRAKRKESLIKRTGLGIIGKQVVGGVDNSHGYAGLASGRNGKTGYDIEGGTRNRRSVWSVITKPFKGAHFATFPPDLIEPCILAGCPKDGIVLDPFSGSGTTAMVARNNGRKSIGIEINEEYCEISKKRLES
jgi:DNA modification methylase